jgi:hypothetical protein
MTYHGTERKPALLGRLTGIERWLPVVGWEGIYEVSNLGRVRSLDRMLPDGRRRKGQLMNTRLQHGYPISQLCRNGKYTHKLVHSLVAEAFIGPRPKGKVVNHKDHIKWHPAVWNLEYVTYSENFWHTYKVRPYQFRGGGHRKLNTEKVRLIRQLLLTKTNGAVAREMGVTIYSINRISSGATWKHVT